jgi:hypothetical protein
MGQKPENISADIPIDLFTTAARLQRVRTACRRFLLLWAMSPAKARQDAALDHALEGVPDDTFEDPEAMLRAMKDFQNHDWSLLYRGSVLDD